MRAAIFLLLQVLAFIWAVPSSILLRLPLCIPLSIVGQRFFSEDKHRLWLHRCVIPSFQILFWKVYPQDPLVVYPYVLGMLVHFYACTFWLRLLAWIHEEWDDTRRELGKAQADRALLQARMGWQLVMILVKEEERHREVELDVALRGLEMGEI
ncbi:hypothetical protein FN846DRAFT_20366 [Sphaerosporella brunnea]|uniref:Uncharacterized protein n=1 Tax=Sphaerosporella brunnea TaxID=1250544 RepID=A0A5J5EVR0_9PEZI|nr:hypothetical protein FN846DRAFT_20366 [Sphaerosporella brunnea]